MLIRLIIIILCIGLLFQTIDRDEYQTFSMEWGQDAALDNEQEETGIEELINIIYPDHFQLQAGFWQSVLTQELTDKEYFYPPGYCTICLEPPKHFT